MMTDTMTEIYKDYTDTITPGIYRHYKGGLFRVIGVGRHSETLEPTVIYQHVEDGALWVRPARMWFDTVPSPVDYHNTTRFQWVGEED